MVSTALEGTVVLSDKLLVEADILAAGAIGEVRMVSGLLEVSRVLGVLVLAAGAMGEMKDFTFFLLLRLRGGMLEAGKMNKAWEVNEVGEMDDVRS